jgi:hypothetical protein
VLRLTGIPAAAEAAGICQLLLHAAASGLAATHACAGNNNKQQQQQQQWKLAQACLCSCGHHNSSQLQGITGGSSSSSSNSHTAAAAASRVQGSSGSSSDLLPEGCCNKLHLWPHLLPAARPCHYHVQYLLHLSKPCHCGAAAHITLAELQQEIQQQVQLSGTCSDHTQVRLLPAVQKPAAAAAAAAGAVGVFISGISVNCSPRSFRQQLLSSFAQWNPLSVVVPAQGAGRYNRGWARVLLPHAAAAADALTSLQGQLVRSTGAIWRVVMIVQWDP